MCLRIATGNLRTQGLAVAVPTYEQRAVTTTTISLLPTTATATATATATLLTPLVAGKGWRWR